MGRFYTEPREPATIDGTKKEEERGDALVEKEEAQMPGWLGRGIGAQHVKRPPIATVGSIIVWWRSASGERSRDTVARGDIGRGSAMKR